MSYTRTTTASRRAARPPQRFIHVSKTWRIIEVPGPNGTVFTTTVWNKGSTYNIGRNKLKAARRAFSLLLRLKSRVL